MKHERYVQLGAKYLEDGERLLAAEDYPQAAEKFWGAAAESMKAVADLRGWRHSSHRDLLVAVGRLAVETGDVELGRLLASAQALHADFYEDFAPAELVKLYADDAKRLVDKLSALAG